MKIPKRIASAIINSLKGGVVPRIGLPYITVGREQEINALLHDVDIIADGGASFRFIVGKYGSGKSFLLQTIRSYVMDRNFVVVDADLSPERRLQGTKGQGLATYKELIRNMSTKTRPDGGALTLILDRWISNVQSETAAESGLDTNDLQFRKAVERKIYEVIGPIADAARFTIPPFSAIFISPTQNAMAPVIVRQRLTASFAEASAWSVTAPRFPVIAAYTTPTRIIPPHK